jgi:ATP-dependent DNA ligase
VLEVNGEDVRREPIEDRTRRLADLLRLPHDGIAINEHFSGDGAVIYKQACALGCEGIVSKRLGSPYRVPQRGRRLRRWPYVIPTKGYPTSGQGAKRAAD